MILSNTSTFSPVTVVQVLNFRHCSYTSHGTPLGTYRAIPRYFLGTALLILAAIPTFRQSIEMYKLTKRWGTNRSMNLLLKEGAVYFVVYVSLVSLCHSCALHSPLSPSLPPKTNLTLRTLSLEPEICFSTLFLRSSYHPSI